MPTFEYRKLFRANITLKVEYKALVESLIKEVAFTKNISPTGMNIIMPDKFEKNTELEMHIYVFEGKKPIFARGKIIWVSDCSYVPKSNKKYYSCGIQCTFMTAKDAISTSDFVRDILQKQSDEQVRKIVDTLEGMSKSQVKK